MTTNQDQQCSSDVTYDFGAKVARCGSTVNGSKIQCDDCREASPSAAVPDRLSKTVREVCEAALETQEEALRRHLVAQSNALKEVEWVGSLVDESRSRIAELQTFLSAK